MARLIINPQQLPPFLLVNQSQSNGYYKIPHELTLREMEKQIIKLTLDRTDGNKTRASQLLDIGLRTLQRKIKEYGIESNFNGQDKLY